MKTVANKRVLDRLFNFRPLLFAAIFLINGIVFAYFQKSEGISAWWLTAFLPITIVTLLLSNGWKNFFQRLTALITLFLFFGLGNTAFRLQIDAFQDCPTLSGEYTLTGTIENCKEDGDVVKALLRNVSIGGTEVEGRFNAYLPTSFAQEYAVGDEILLTGEVDTRTELFGDYGFRDSAVSKNTRYTVKAENAKKVGRTDNVILLIRARMEEVLFVGMDELPASLTLALLTGDASDMDEGVMENMRRGGISHIFAVSGLNVGALFGFCLFLFAKTPIRRAPKWLRFVIVVGVLFFYSAICSFTASVVRAAIMCAVGYFVKLMEVGYDLLDVLGAAAIFILLLLPSELFGVGFQLSFLACVGLFLLAKPIGQVFDELKKVVRKVFPKRYTKDELEALNNGDTLPLSLGGEIYRGVAGLLSASIAAQIATAPVLLIRFGYLSGWSLLLNFIFVPFTDGIFTILLVVTAACCLLPTAFSSVLLYIPSVVWTAAMLVFEVVDFSSFSLTGVQLSLPSCVCYYVGVTFLSDKWNLPKVARAWLSLLFFGVFILVTALSRV